MSPLLLGSIGVTLLLIAFILNVLKYLDETGPVYLLMNFVGAGLSCWYALVSDIIPFVVLEGVWAAAAVARLAVVVTKKSSPKIGEPV